MQLPLGILPSSSGGISYRAQKEWFVLVWGVSELSLSVWSNKHKRDNYRKEKDKKENFKILYDNSTKEGVDTEILKPIFVIIFIEI